ncbi:hypothetical protein H4W23_28275 [Streptomyces gardneri]|uniref:hypothetical protein n=1 Tax=Streptomyces gardneri TaxID=66892 RepID=UPI0006BC7E84|nr:hypothetical protein [Streptomyces gardneri]QPK48156.1 hypothetical protein H4W23_28275 [Streptomyces gardneri]WRK39616.1 hypothetical protein U0M97_28410 [Streptomyces venezuelae]CUM38257.1 putative membrane protei [Streptomyces venezuelae]
MAVQTTPAAGRFTFVQVAIALQTLALFFQAATAGALLSSSLSYQLHDIGSRVMYGASMLYVLAAVLAWKPGGGSARPALYATGFLVLASAQVALGVAHMPAFHVPLGIVMFALSVLALAATVRSTRAAAAA